MEGDACSNSTSVQRLQFDFGTSAKLGLQGGKPNNSLNHRKKKKKMDGEAKKAGPKRRLKGIKISVDSGDDEPIGSLFKLRRHRNPKKVKVGLEGGGSEGQKVEVRKEKLDIVDEDPGGMDDTLASFRKKLKGPKKDVGSVNMRQRSSAVNGSVGDNEALDAKLESQSKTGEKPQDVDDSVSHGTLDNGVQKKGKGKVKRYRIGLKKKYVVNHTEINIESDCLESQAFSSQGQKDGDSAPEAGSNNSSDEKLEDSLSFFFQKAQCRLMRKSHPKSSLKQNSRARMLEDGFLSSYGGILRDKNAEVCMGHQSMSAIKLPCKSSNSDDSPFLLSGSSMRDSESDCCKMIEKQPFSYNLCQTSNYVEENHEKIQDIYSVPELRDEGMTLIDNKCLGSSSDIVKEQLLVDIQGTDLQEIPATDLCSLNEVCQLDNKHYNFSMEKTETKALINENQICSMGNIGISGHDAMEMPDSNTTQRLMEDMHGSCEGEANKSNADALIQQSEGVCFSKKLISTAEPENSSSPVKEEIPAPCPNGMFKMHNLTSENILDLSTNYLSGKSGSQHNTEECQTQLQLSYSDSDPSKGRDTGSDGDNKKAYAEDLDLDLDSSKRDQPHDCGFSPTAEKSCGGPESGYTFEGNLLEKAKKVVAFPQRGNSASHETQPSEEAAKGSSVPVQDCSLNYEANGASSASIAPEESESCADDVMSIHNYGKKVNKLSTVQRIGRSSRKRRHGDMAYEGDADWEILMNGKGFFENHCDRSFKEGEKFDTSLNFLKDAEIGGAAAVSVGLKAKSASSIEKIKFKEVLKRKGGLQEYLECRNHILGLWNKDVSRIFPITDCGVPDNPSEDELPRTSLIRDIYLFLDQRGYINVGIASKKEKDEPSTHNYELIKEKKLEDSSAASVADSEDGVAFILGQVKRPAASLEGKNGIIHEDGNLASEAAEGTGLLPSIELKLPSTTECEGPTDNCGQNGTINVKPSKKLVRLDASSVDQSVEIHGDRTVSAVTPAAKNNLPSLQSPPFDCVCENDYLHCDSGVGRRIIIIGAGPAGLTAARHLQRQGFSVTVLEARNRIGGRVYTDRSSLSVPVDLGASIITGIEADVASERRPDPSALVCAQLGLELTVLHGFCPLYDTVTGQKVPPDLDDALQAEFNSLIDDIDLLVDQIGKDRANRMSLEDGLEYGLRRLRLSHLKTDIEENELNDPVDSLCGSNTSSTIGRHSLKEEILSPLERRVMNWHFAHTEYGCAAFLREVSLPHWNQDEHYGGFGGAHAMIKGGYSTVVESLGKGLCILLNHVVTDISYGSKDSSTTEDGGYKVKVLTSNGSEFLGDAVLITVPLGCLKAETIKFSPPLPDWKRSSVQRLGFGVLNKVILEFPEVFWDDSVDYFGATAEETDRRGHCFMFWNVRKTVGAPVLIALVVGKAAMDAQVTSLSDYVNHAVMVLRKLFGETSVPDPVASVVTDWGSDPYSYGAYSYVAIGASGEDYDILCKPVQNCLFFAGEATCKEHPDTVGGAMISGLREAVRIIDILYTGNDYGAEVEAVEAMQIKPVSEKDEVRDIINRLEAVELSNVLTRQTLLRNMFFTAKTTVGRLHLAKELLNLPVEALKSFAGTKEGLTMLNTWILDSMGKNGTQLLRHCVHLLVHVSTDLLAVRLSGIGKTVKEKVCAHTSRDIRAIASQLVNVWLEIFRKEKTLGGGRNLLRQTNTSDFSKRKSLKEPFSAKPPIRTDHVASEIKGRTQAFASVGSHLGSNANIRREGSKPVKLETISHSSISRLETEVEDSNLGMSEEEQAAFAAAEVARAAAEAAAKAYASSEATCNASLQLPKIPSFHKFARREQYAQMDESELRKKWLGGVLGRQDCISEIDSRNCRVRDWSVDFSAACLNLDSSRMSVDNLSQQSHSNENACHLKFREHSGESAAVDSSIFTRAWVDAAGNGGIKDYHAIERWQSQAAAADPNFFCPTTHVKDEEDSNTSSRPPMCKHDGRANESSISQVTIIKESLKNHPRGADRIKQAVVDYVTSLLMPLYKARKIDRDGYKSIMKKSATKVMEQATDAEKTMVVSEFLDFKRKNKIRSFVDKLIERHMGMKQAPKP